MEKTNNINIPNNFIPVQVITRGTAGGTWREKAIMALPTGKANGKEVVFAKSQKELADKIGVHQATLSYCVRHGKPCHGYDLVSLDNNVDGALNAIALHHNEALQAEANREAERAAKLSELEAKAAQWDAYQAQLAAEAEAKAKAKEAHERAVANKQAEIESIRYVRKEQQAQVDRLRLELGEAERALGQSDINLMFAEGELEELLENSPN